MKALSYLVTLNLMTRASLKRQLGSGDGWLPVKDIDRVPDS